MQRHQQGFTLIELMIAVVILALLAAFAYPSYQKFVKMTREENARADLVKNTQLVERYYSINKTFPPSTNSPTTSTGKPSSDPNNPDSSSSLPNFTLSKGKSDEYFDISLESGQSNKYRLIATPNAKNKLNTRDIIYDSIDGMIACENKECVTF